MIEKRLPSLRLRFLRSLVLSLSACACAQTITVSGSVEVARQHSSPTRPDNSGVVIWLVPHSDSGSGNTPHVAAVARPRAVLVQRHKTFEPHLIVIPAGSEVDFPNRDPFFHNVFSLFEGKRFDLGLYEAGSTRSIRFDRPGISYLFCNIHPEMSAVIIALDTPYYSISERTGQITIPDVPPGRYTMHVWREGASATSLKSLVRPILVSSDSSSLGRIDLPVSDALPLTHKNKYGLDYENPEPPGLVYEHQ
jgi:plastocyanin